MRTGLDPPRILFTPPSIAHLVSATNIDPFQGVVALRPPATGEQAGERLLAIQWPHVQVTL